ncbi:NAD-dependent histone deacetylase sir2, partial [Haplosporangium sp. Z 27]
EEEEEELDDDGDMQDMEGLTTELSRRQLPLQDGWQTGTHVGASSSSSLLSPRHHSIAGFATGTTEPRSGSIEDIHHDILSAAAAEAAASLRSPIFASSSHFSHGSTSGQSHASHDASNRMIVSSEEDVDDDEDEENKIRLMFTEKMPKDLGEDDIDIVGYSRRPSEDLGPIPEDTQEVDVEDHTDDDDDDIVVDNDGIESSGNVKIKDNQLPNSVPQILINRTPNHQMEFDVQLLGNCDNIVAELCRMVGWELKHEKLPGGTSNVPNMDVFTNKDGSGAGGRAAWTFMEPNTYLFEGADLEEINFEAIQEQNRKRLRREAAAVEGHEGDEDEDEDEDEEEEEELDDD